MKIRLGEKEGLEAGKAIEIQAGDKSPASPVSVTIWNEEQHTSIELTAETARQVAMALITATGGGGDAG